MSLYESLDRFVGAGLLAWASAAGWPEISPAAVARGPEFSAFLRDRGEAASFGSVLDTLAQEIWLSQDTRGIPHQVAEAHAVALAAILPAAGPKPADVAAAMAEVRAGRRIDHHAASTAADVMARAMASPLAAGLRADVVLFLLERLATHLVVDPALMSGLRPAMAAFSATAASGQDVAPIAALPAVAAIPTGEAAAILAAMPTLAPSSVEPQSTAPPVAPQPAPASAAPTPLVPATAVSLAPARAPASSELAGAVAVKTKYRLSDTAFQRFVALLDSQTVRPEQRLSRLDELGAWLEATVAQLSRASNDDHETRALKERAAKALSDGEFEIAVDLLKAVRRSLRENRRRTEQRLQEEMENLRVQMAEEAVATARLAELALARSDYDEAADLFAEAAAGAPQADPDVEVAYRLRLADAWYRKGEDTADAAALAAAAQAYATVAAQALKIRSAKPFAAAKRGQGAALFRLGEVEPGTERLRGAVAAWREVLPHLGRPEDALARGLLQVQIGAALALIAERGAEPAAAAEAIAELRRALEFLPAAQVPLDRATAELYLGRVLVHQSEAPGMHNLLAEAITLFTAAAQAWATAREPLQWAAAQLNLGAALVRIGEVEDRRRNWTAAANAFVQALQVFEQEGAADSAAQVRNMVRQLHTRLENEHTAALGQPVRRASGT